MRRRIKQRAPQIVRYLRGRGLQREKSSAPRHGKPTHNASRDFSAAIADWALFSWNEPIAAKTRQPDNRSFDIFAKPQLKDDCYLEQDRDRRQEFAEHEPWRMHGDIERRIWTNLAEDAVPPQRRKVP